MSNPPPGEERDTILRNIRLVATTGNFLIFIISPLLGLAAAFFVITHRHQDLWLLNKTQQAFLAMILGAGGPCFLAMWRGEIIKEQLREAGYVQRRTRERDIDFAISFAPVLAFLFLGHRYNPDENTSTFALVAHVVLIVGLYWWMIVMISLGPVLWFTVKVR